jgi:hypothetical protein
MDPQIHDFPNYRINVDGVVFSNYMNKTSKTSDNWKPLVSVLDKGTGYYLVTLVNSGTRKNQFIHRLLAQHYIPNPLNKPQVNHIDGNKQNNALSNLEWVTAKENSVHAVKLGLCDRRRKQTEVCILQYTLDGEYLTEHVSIHEAGRSTQIAWQNISKVLRGLRKSAGGYFWVYK